MVNRDWDFFDKIYCISLDTRKDRRIQAEQQFESVGLTGKVEFMTFMKHPSDSEQGIYESHMACIQKGISSNAATILVFEDDLLFDGFSDRRLKDCIDFLSTDRSWNMFFFGCLVNGIRKTTHPSIAAITYRCLAHAYVIQREFGKTIANIRWQGIPFDTLVSSYTDGMYMIYPSFVFQSSSSTDNDKLIRLDALRRRLGGLQAIQKMNHFYYSHQIGIIIFHIAAALAVLGLIMFR